MPATCGPRHGTSLLHPGSRIKASRSLQRRHLRTLSPVVACRLSTRGGTLRHELSPPSRSRDRQPGAYAAVDRMRLLALCSPPDHHSSQSTREPCQACTSRSRRGKASQTKIDGESPRVQNVTTNVTADVTSAETEKRSTTSHLLDSLDFFVTGDLSPPLRQSSKVASSRRGHDSDRPRVNRAGPFRYRLLAQGHPNFRNEVPAYMYRLFESAIFDR